ncbi:hypothetical protein [Paenibacillus sp. PK3_47]|uniref:hypothetical protein n=1 Tax=Paenibacillus sp. PK3_47 TaxID=2072642 RepID=UPI00201DF7C9|nr:hypothetical protein [Paenibacillus sp. PK3_47]
MWREVALKKLKAGNGTLKFKTQREINEESNKRLEQYQEAQEKLNELNIKFNQIAGSR